ncbi:MAG: hypothetical protein IBJ03_00885 [Gemmatimonadaceae bacterium]|nr:hypothetical protein [Gemmatimonadaceae bacterium]
MIGTRNPHWQRVAIFRHEFHPQVQVAQSTTEIEISAESAPTSPSPSLIALWRGTMARAVVGAAQLAGHASVSPAFPSSSTGAVGADLSSWTPTCARLLEAA